jgi:hypothetical protein
MKISERPFYETVPEEILQEKVSCSRTRVNPALSETQDGQLQLAAVPAPHRHL